MATRGDFVHLRGGPASPAMPQDAVPSVETAVIQVLKEDLRLDMSGMQGTYEGNDPIQLYTNGISANGPIVQPGSRVWLCKNQYTDCPEKVRVHVFFKRTPPAEPPIEDQVWNGPRRRCACGVCGSTFTFFSGTCECEEKEIKDPMHEPCCIQ